MITPPRTRGNVFNHSYENGVHRYLSDQWGGRLFGFEERNGICLGQSADLAVGAIGFGGGSVHAGRNLPEQFPYHLCDEDIRATYSEIGAAEASLAMSLTLLDQQRNGLPTTVAITVPQPSIFIHEAEEGSDLRQQLDCRLKAAVQNLRKWGKSLFVDRIHLSLAEGSLDLSEAKASDHYADVAKSIQTSIVSATGQPVAPMVLVCQDGGTTQSGNSETILAEGRLDVEHPTSDFIVVTPTYWCDFMVGSTATLKPQSALLVSELEAYALYSVHNGQRWYCPLLEDAKLDGHIIAARFLSLTPLVIDKGPHGFNIEGLENDAEIVNVTAKDKVISIELSKPPKGQLRLLYAYNGQHNRGNRSINTGAVRDQWQETSVTGAALRRWALSAAVHVKA